MCIQANIRVFMYIASTLYLDSLNGEDTQTLIPGASECLRKYPT